MNFKKFLAATALAFVMPCLANAQEAEQAPKEEGWIFTNEVRLPITSIKNQNAAGTCWCYSSLAFVEAELLRFRLTFMERENYYEEKNYFLPAGTLPDGHNAVRLQAGCHR